MYIKEPLTTKETNQLRLHWERQAQKSGEVEKDREVLNLYLNQEGLLESRGRLQGDYPVYLPETSLYSQRIVKAHLQTLHGGVGWKFAQSAMDAKISCNGKGYPTTWMPSNHPFWRH